MAGPDVLVQVHIPKCAGTSISAWLRESSNCGLLSGFGSFYTDFVFDDDSLWQAGLDDSRLAAVSAHSIRRFPPEIHGRRMRYFTILRHPVPHFLSMVRYAIQERAAMKIPPDVGNSSREVAAWLLDAPPGTDFRENTQTNHLALYPWCDASGGRCTPETYGSWDPEDQAAYERERLDVARAELQSFLGVGTVERLTETLELVRARSATLGLNLLPVAAVPHINVTRVPGDDFSWLENDPVGERFYASVADDWQLYLYAQQLLVSA